MDALGLPVRVLVTAGTVADYTQSGPLIENIPAEMLNANRGYDIDALLMQTAERGIEAVIPPRKRRKIQRKYGRDMYRLRHLVENAIRHLKQWRGIATRYDKNTASFLAAIQIRCKVIWGNMI